MNNRFEPTKRDMLPLYEFKLRMATIERENLFSQLPAMLRRLHQINDEIALAKLASEEGKAE